MTLFDAFRYDGKRVLVVGGATGMGAAAAELVQDAGAEVVVMDFAEVTLPGVKAIHVNLADRTPSTPPSTSAADRCTRCSPAPGWPTARPGIEKINFIGHRHLIDRMLAGGMLPRGAAIGFISSAAGLGWEANLAEIKEFLDTPDLDDAVAWIEAHGKADYFHTKQTICAYVARPGLPPAQAGHPDQRHLPGPDRHPAGPGQQGDVAGVRRRLPRARSASRPSTPLEQAYPLVFLCSDAAAADQRDHPDHRRRAT